jgi:hypothetical protein
VASNKKKKAPKEKRTERRFVAGSAFPRWLVLVLGALGALALGAGAWAYFYGTVEGHLFDPQAAVDKWKAIPSYLIAAGAVLSGITIWLGTSSEPPIRVGAPGIGVERGEVRRMPWWGLKQLSFEAGSLCLVLSGEDETGSSWTFKVPLKAHPEAVGWIVKEASDRVPKRVDISDEIYEKLPGAAEHAGQRIDLEPLQVVGRKDALTGKTISYEPDARVCTRCERVYFKRSVPKKCKCGASLAHVRGDARDAQDEHESERDVEAEAQSEGEDKAEVAKVAHDDDSKEPERHEAET